MSNEIRFNFVGAEFQITGLFNTWRQLSVKKCAKCGALKPLDEFHKNRTTKDGLQSACKSCKYMYAKADRIANPEKYKERSRELNAELTRKRRTANAKPYDIKVFKQCSQCGGVKKRTEFGPRKCVNETILAICRPCKTFMDRQYRENNPLTDEQRQRKANKAREPKRKATNRKWAENNRSSVNASKRKYATSTIGKAKAAENCARRTANLQAATPPWAKTPEGKKELVMIYLIKLAKQEGSGRRYDADHVIPLKGKLVSGLHCADNIQIRRAKNNNRKSNNFDQEAESERQLEITLAKLAS